MSVWSQEQRDLIAADVRVEYERARVAKAALHWSKLQSSTARSRDLGLACNRLREAQAARDALREREAGQ